MGQKLILWSALFITLLLINSFIAFKLLGSSYRAEQTEKILDEIAHVDPSQNQKQFSFSSAPLVMGAYEAEVTTADGRAANLRAFFRKYNSPLYDISEYIVTASDKYGLDYRLLPAIAMQESGLCRVIPDDSHNCWGWGIYGTTITKFGSYEEAIDTVAQGLKAHYIDKGLITASSIMEKYTPSSNGSWAHGVNTFLKAVEQ